MFAEAKLLKATLLIKLFLFLFFDVTNSNRARTFALWQQIDIAKILISLVTAADYDISIFTDDDLITLFDDPDRYAPQLKANGFAVGSDAFGRSFENQAWIIDSSNQHAITLFSGILQQSVEVSIEGHNPYDVFLQSLNKYLGDPNPATSIVVDATESRGVKPPYSPPNIYIP